MNKIEKNNRDFKKIATTSYQPKKTDASHSSQSDKSPPSLKKRLLWVCAILIGLIFVVFIILLTWNARNFSDASEKLFGQSNVIGLIPVNELRQDESGRTNILIIGNAGDRDEHGGTDLTDTILFMSLNGSGDGYMLSIPRDLYVSIPGYSDARINEAFLAGKIAGFSKTGFRDDGIGLLESVIQQNLGLEIHYYMLLNFSAVEQVVDSIGGISVEIDSPDSRGLYDPNFRPQEGGPLRLENGLHHLDGKTALRLTRARGSAGGYGFPRSDFNRTQNQQKVVTGILQELTWQKVFDPRVNKQLFDAVAQNAVTDVRLDEVIPVYRLLTRTPLDEIRSYTLQDIDGENLLTTHQTSGGALVEIPRRGIHDFTDIRDAIQKIHR